MLAIIVRLNEIERNLALIEFMDKSKLETPTWCLIMVQYALWGLLFYSLNSIPVWVVCIWGAFMVAWYGNLQHEIIHGHPTGSRLFNSLFAWAPFTLWMPYHVYARGHLAHHLTPTLADPAQDPESYYFLEADWQSMNPVYRFIMVANNTIAGRMVLGPAIVIVRFFITEIAIMVKGDFSNLTGWIFHIALSAGFLYGVDYYLGFSAWLYVAGIAYPGLSISLIRSFYEHRPSRIDTERTAIVEAGPFWSLIFLNNNLHVVHHDNPGTSWYLLPAIYKANREDILEKNGGFFFNGYGEVFKRFFLKSKDTPLYPL